MYDIKIKTDLGEYFYSGSCLCKTPMMISVFTRNGSSRIEFGKYAGSYAREIPVRINPKRIELETVEKIEVNGKEIYKKEKKDDCIYRIWE